MPSRACAMSATCISPRNGLYLPPEWPSLVKEYAAGQRMDGSGRIPSTRPSLRHHGDYTGAGLPGPDQPAAGIPAERPSSLGDEIDRTATAGTGSRGERARGAPAVPGAAVSLP